MVINLELKQNLITTKTIQQIDFQELQKKKKILKLFNNLAKAPLILVILSFPQDCDY